MLRKILVAGGIIISFLSAPCLKSILVSLALGRVFK
jgi:hypothetical protein